MPKWTVTDPNTGEVFNGVEAATAADATSKVRLLKLQGNRGASQQTLAGMGKAIGSGLVRGAAGLAGLPGDVLSLVDAGVRNAPRLIGQPKATTGKIAVLPTSNDFVKWFERDVTPLYEPQTTAERFVGKVAEYAPGVVQGPGNFARRALTQVAAPALGEETLGTLAHEYAPEYETAARLVGSVGGGSVVAPRVQQALTPHPANPILVRQADELRRHGVYPSAGQSTGNYRLMTRESEWADGGAPGLNDKHLEQFTRATGQPAGEDVISIDPDVVNNAHARIGDVMDTMERRYSIDNNDQQIVSDLGDAWDYYDRNIGEGHRVAAVRQTIQDIINLRRKGPIPGDVFAKRRTQLRDDIRAATNPVVKQTLIDIQEALLEAMERSMTATATNVPARMADVRAWRQARRQYANLMVVEDAMLKGGAYEKGMGYITPAALAGAASSGPRKKGYIRGNSDYTSLARAGQAVLRPIPQSGTSARGMAQRVPLLVGGLVGGGVAAATGHDVSALLLPAAGAAAGEMTSAAMGRGIMHPAMQRYLRNQAFGVPPAPGDSLRQAARTGATYGPRIMMEPLIAPEDELAVEEPVALGPRRAPDEDILAALDEPGGGLSLEPGERRRPVIHITRSKAAEDYLRLRPLIAG